MKRIVLVCCCITTYLLTIAQSTDQKTTAPKVYRSTTEKINDLVHTKLDARFDFTKAQLNGKVWITLKPHFYATDSLLLDAKGMDIKQIAVVKGGKNNPLKYKYDGMLLDIDLDKSYKGSETYTIYIDYTAKPDEYTGKGSAAITDAKGLYFINPRGEDKTKPTQVWTQGETEATSVWVPTIDKPNQKTTNEILMTVPAKYVTLSNGILASQKNNSDGTRTDHWKMDQPHAPYLFFMGIGDYAIIKDKYKDKEVNYYVEKEYAPVARGIFGKTPQMIALFSRLTGVDYPWAKYAQIVGRDYVSGAMENTTATLHQESAYQDARELTDGNRWEEVIAHELFHQWFGDYVTTESWSNITLNESFATLGSQLWNEFYYGKDEGYAERYSSAQGYINSNSAAKDLVRFNYNDKEDVFDAVSYNKGGAILQMLRAYVGDSAFFKSINLYLNTNKYKAAEAHQLRLAFEEVTGKDLNWFWNQWYFGSGHPKLDITYNYNENTKKAEVIVKQTQTGDKVFMLPVAIDVYDGASKVRHNVLVQNKVDTFQFAVNAKPDLINFDADKVLLTQKTENKSLDNYLHQYKYAGNYIDRLEAIDAAAKKQEETRGVELLMMAMNDKFAPLRSYSIGKLDLKKEAVKTLAEPALAKLAQNDAKKTVRAAAIARLGDYKFAKYNTLFKTALTDSSYTVAGNALEALGKVDSVAAFNEAKRLAGTKTKGKLSDAITKSIIRYGDESSAEFVLSNFENLPFGQAKFEALQPLVEFLSKVKSLETFKRGVDGITAFHMAIPEAYRGQVTPVLNNMLQTLQKTKEAAGMKEQADYVKSQLSPGNLKGF
ncbi:MAG TPA: M1 family metallopeptidase [Chitinophagaceae bacterium]|nr:M1 family metallopeptidase [Chitinophagaceae bacterium]